SWRSVISQSDSFRFFLRKKSLATPVPSFAFCHLLPFPQHAFDGFGDWSQNLLDLIKLMDHLDVDMQIAKLLLEMMQTRCSQPCIDEHRPLALITLWVRLHRHNIFIHWPVLLSLHHSDIKDEHEWDLLSFTGLKQSFRLGEIFCPEDNVSIIGIDDPFNEPTT